MATIFGQHGIEYGDRRVYQRLARLSDRFTIYAQPAIHSPQGSCHPDYVIVDKEKGLIVVEVKDWADILAARGEQAAVYPSEGDHWIWMNAPVEQARQASFCLRNALQADPHLIHHRGPYKGKTLLPVGYAGFLPNLKHEKIRKLRKCWGYQTLFGKEDLIVPGALEKKLDDFNHRFSMHLEEPERTFSHLHSILLPEVYFYPTPDQKDIRSYERLCLI